MKPFDDRNRERNEDTHTIADVSAAASFLVGSIPSLWTDYETQAIWVFIIGAVFFCATPTLRRARAVPLWRMAELRRAGPAAAPRVAERGWKCRFP
jgi:hypothetical protein